MSEEQKPQPDSAEQAPTPLISIDDFSKVRLTTAEVVAAEEIPKADKLLKLTLKLGGGPDQEARVKQIVAGIKQHYSPMPTGGLAPDEKPENHKPSILGKTIIIVDNLVPTKLRGVDSNGMLLAVRLPDGSLSLLTTDKPSPSGLRVG
jgi:methionyl-tRNA synthetase